MFPTETLPFSLHLAQSLPSSSTHWSSVSFSLGFPSPSPSFPFPLLRWEGPTSSCGTWIFL